MTTTTAVTGRNTTAITTMNLVTYTIHVLINTSEPYVRAGFSP